MICVGNGTQRVLVLKIICFTLNPRTPIKPDEHRYPESIHKEREDCRAYRLYEVPGLVHSSTIGDTPNYLIPATNS